MSGSGINRADRWLGNKAPNPSRGNRETRAMDTARRIDDRLFEIVVSRKDPVTRSTIQLPPQMVRIEVVQGVHQAGQQHAITTTMTQQYVVVVGYKDHPTIPNTNLIRADRFLYQNRMYEVYDVIDTVPGRAMFSCELNP